jgi:SLBB domain-containing protein
MRLALRLPCVMVWGALLVVAREAAAQGAAAESGRAVATRQQLERLAADADAAAAATESPEAVRQAKRREAESIRERLQNGDFRTGDRIFLIVEGDSALTDTVVVLPGPTLRVLSLPEDSLRGVLRSEVQSHLTQWVTRFYKNARVRAIPLIRFGVLGEVGRPGYYRLPVDISVTDAIMTAGGPTARADIPKTVVRRRSQILLSKAATREAIVAGQTLDQLGLDAGDELVVGAKSERSWMSYLSIATAVTGLFLTTRAVRGP